MAGSGLCDDDFDGSVPIGWKEEEEGGAKKRKSGVSWKSGARISSESPK